MLEAGQGLDLVDDPSDDDEDTDIEMQPAAVARRVNDTALRVVLARRQDCLDANNKLFEILGRELYKGSGCSYGVYIRSCILIQQRSNDSFSSWDNLIAMSQLTLPRELDVPITPNVLRRLCRNLGATVHTFDICAKCEGVVYRNADPILEAQIGPRQYANLSRCPIPTCRAPRFKEINGKLTPYATVTCESITENLLLLFLQPEIAERLGRSWPTKGPDGMVHTFLQI